jgi:hypothetical protein
VTPRSTLAKHGLIIITGARRCRDYKISDEWPVDVLSPTRSPRQQHRLQGSRQPAAARKTLCYDSKSRTPPSVPSLAKPTLYLLSNKKSNARELRGTELVMKQPSKGLGQPVNAFSVWVYLSQPRLLHLDNILCVCVAVALSKYSGLRQQTACQQENEACRIWCQEKDKAHKSTFLKTESRRNSPCGGSKAGHTGVLKAAA